MSKEVLRVEGLSVGLRGINSVLMVREVSFELKQGELLALVGESGAGKSLTVLAIAGLLKRKLKLYGGKIIFNNSNLCRFTPSQFRKIWGRELAIVFQNPINSLHPLLTIGNQICEAVMSHNPGISKKSAISISKEQFNQLGLEIVSNNLNVYSHQLSVGMAQRVAIAIAMINKPKLLIVDEPTSGLDTKNSNLVKQQLFKLCKQNETALLWVTHDLNLIKDLAKNVVVMYAGNVVENASSYQLLSQPKHPYTKGLVHSASCKVEYGKFNYIKGEPPSSIQTEIGCPFFSRCDSRLEICSVTSPKLVQVDNSKVRCFLFGR